MIYIRKPELTTRISVTVKYKKKKTKIDEKSNLKIGKEVRCYIQTEKVLLGTKAVKRKSDQKSVAKGIATTDEIDDDNVKVGKEK